MSRLARTLVHDVRLQQRNGAYHAAAFVALFAIVGLPFVPADVRSLVLPAFVLSNLLMGTFFFIAGLVMLERTEGSLQALVVTPLRDREYLLSKTATLAGLGLVENLAIVAVAQGTDFDLLPMVGGILLGAAVYALLGFIAVAPYAAINEYLMASMLWVVFLSLPYLHYAGLWTGRWFNAFFWLHPLQPSLTLMRGAFRPLPTIEALYALLYGALWVLWLTHRARAAFREFVVGEARP